MSMVQMEVSVKLTVQIPDQRDCAEAARDVATAELRRLLVGPRERLAAIIHASVGDVKLKSHG